MIEPAKIDVATLREAYRAKKLALFDTLRFARAPTRSVHTVLRQLSALADQTLCALWHEADFGDSLTLAAVGGFGRGELFPYSDVDVLLLLPPEGHDSEIDPARIEAFIGQCWDAGLEIGSSVRTVEECELLCAIGFAQRCHVDLGWFDHGFVRGRAPLARLTFSLR